MHKMFAPVDSYESIFCFIFLSFFPCLPFNAAVAKDQHSVWFALAVQKCHMQKVTGSYVYLYIKSLDYDNGNGNCSIDEL